MSRLSAAVARVSTAGSDSTTQEQEQAQPKTEEHRSPGIQRAPVRPLKAKALAADAARATANVAQSAGDPVPAAPIDGTSRIPSNDRRARSVDSVEVMVKDIFKQVRRAYSNGLKSSNKTYSQEIKTRAGMFGMGKQHKDDTKRLKQAGEALSILRDQNIENVVKGSVPAPQQKLVIDAANCGELARASAKIAVEKGMHAEVWRLDDDDHGFAVIGKPPAGDTVDFAGWKNIWIVDPWLGVEAKATDYIEKANEKMRKWQSEGKVMLSLAGESQALDTDWLDAINTGKKSVVEAPSPGNENPWKHLSTAVDFRRIVESQDLRLPALRIGDTKIGRVELYDMGAVLDGKPIGLDGIEHVTMERLSDHLYFDKDVLRQKIREHGENGDHQAIARVADVLTEIGMYKRAQASGELLVSSRGGVDKTSSVLNRQLDRLGKLAAEARLTAEAKNPTTFILPNKTAATFNNVGVGLQAFGAYNGVRGMVDAIARGDTEEAILSAAGVASEGISLGAESGFTALGKAIEKGGVDRLVAFSQTSLGKIVGGPAKLGTNVSRVGGAVGLVVSLPLDIYGAVKSFQKAASSEGKIAQDHYVDGGLAVAGAATSIVTTGAGFAGLSAAGPAGLAAGALLLAGSRIYHSVRYVEDLSEHTTLSGGETFVTGLSAFFGGGAPQAVEDRVSVSKAKKGYDAEQRAAAMALMQQNPNYGHVVFGDAIIKQQPPLVHFGGGGLGVPGYQTIQRPAIVKGNQADDRIDASTSVESVRTAVKAPAGNGSDVLWMTGKGDDELAGSNDRANHFVIDQGKKRAVGGHKDDVFELASLPSSESILDGGAGNDSLRMEGVPAKAAPQILTVLPALNRSATDAPSEPETPGFISVDGEHLTRLKSIENVSTSAGAKTTVIGNDLANAIVLNGRDDMAAGQGGNDTYVVNGGGVVTINAGGGVNRYRIGAGIDKVTIQSDHVDGVHELSVDFDSDDLTVRSLEDLAALEIVAKSPSGQKRIILPDVFRRDAGGELVPARAEGSIALRTRDRFILTPVLSSIKQASNGLLHLGVMQDKA